MSKKDLIMNLYELDKLMVNEGYYSEIDRKLHCEGSIRHVLNDGVISYSNTEAVLIVYFDVIQLADVNESLMTSLIVVKSY